ncbi:bacteriohopanetetrol glucosamine biosynthesis glycosyltransferase HpnI [Bombella sp. TMW 2.2559]|uniref:Bacteriohopanetetrol glucosamine biosynthesis glycosyltransferase HpnI n=1 Tax=Bombella dulcis TaxID=2967339 RepID=A0ABT3WCT4_9PROT|nr:bacteriohopanetetrol glucosamine biosynthesis glycosyltransferase HpnI [Bombella dulcis]MCX5616884.1 bacteriohopanetetrol glucosamine biosynthesis glycosyltransferase HpnI [Bombella dulcis]
MPSLLTLASAVSGVFSLAGYIQEAIGTILLDRFRRTVRVPGAPALSSQPQARHDILPGVTLMKPLHGDEPLLEEALESFFRQDYPATCQIVFGLQDEADPALTVLQRLKQRYPERDVTVVINPTHHGPNRKVGNLINMYPSCRHNILIISDSDIHVSTDYISSIVHALHQDGVQLVTTLYAGLPASNTLIRKLGAYSINANFLPGVMISRLMGREDCLGATMALRRKHLTDIGGLETLVQHVADDALLGRLIRQNGGKITLAPTICQTTVAETSLKDLFHHELRWGRTVRSVEPVGYGLSALQLPLFWGSLCVLFAPARLFPWVMLGAGLLCRNAMTRHIGRLTNCPMPGLFPFLIFRDWLSLSVMLGSARGTRVTWRGQSLHISRGKKLPKSL